MQQQFLGGGGEEVQHILINTETHPLKAAKSKLRSGHELVTLSSKIC